MQLETTRRQAQALTLRSKLPGQIGYGVLYIVLSIVAVFRFFRSCGSCYSP
jgi:raffinose/stachyose/melibiose transport system permease protein